jgi:tRNA_anti-like
MKKKIGRMAGWVSLLVIIIAGLFIYRAWNQPHRSAETETTVAVNAPQLAAAFEKDETSANKQYLGQAVEVSGTVDGISVNQQNKPVLVLRGTDMSGVQCSLLKEAPGLKKGDAVVIKGFCSGYLTDVVMDRCVVSR